MLHDPIKARWDKIDYPDKVDRRRKRECCKRAPRRYTKKQIAMFRARERRKAFIIERMKKVAEVEAQLYRAADLARALEVSEAAICQFRKANAPDGALKALEDLMTADRFEEFHNHIRELSTYENSI